MFVIPYVGLVIYCAVPDDFQKESVRYVLGGIEQPHVWRGVSGKGGHGGNVFEVVGYQTYFLCAAYRQVIWILSVILGDGSEEPLFNAGHVCLNEFMMVQT